MISECPIKANKQIFELSMTVTLPMNPHILLSLSVDCAMITLRGFCKHECGVNSSCCTCVGCRLSDVYLCMCSFECDEHDAIVFTFSNTHVCFTFRRRQLKNK